MKKPNSKPSNIINIQTGKPYKTKPNTDPIQTEQQIEAKVLKDIFKSLYYPDCPYEFSVLPPDILGNVYEQFLGKPLGERSHHLLHTHYKARERV